MASSERFGYAWNKFSSLEPDYEKQFAKWTFPLKKEDFKGKKILDAGCGMGRNAYWMMKYGAKQLTCIDFDQRCVDVTKKNLASFPNSQVLYQSIYTIPFDQYFDYAISIGVIHHLKDPRKALSMLVKSVKKGGKILIWVYGLENNEWIVKYINPIRKVTSRLPLFLVNFITYFFTIPLFLFLRFPQKSPYLKQISKFKFKHIHSIVFDQLIPSISNYWRKEEVLKLAQKNELTNIEIFHVNGNSWTLVAERS